MQTDTTVAICAVAGMGGVGKTELAFQYALRHRDLGSYPGGVCWLAARQDIGLQIVEFARIHLGYEPPTDEKLPQKVTLCWKNWRAGAALIVLDDVQTYGEIAATLPLARSQFKVVLTTRLKLEDDAIRLFPLEKLRPLAAFELLYKTVQQDKTPEQESRIAHEQGTAEALCEWLGYLPLGLELVGRYLVAKRDLSLAKLQERLEQQRLDARAFNLTPEMRAKEQRYENLAKAFELSWQELDGNAQLVAMLLSLFALAEIPWELVQACLTMGEEDLEDLRDKQLLGLHLLERPKDSTYQLHQLLREFFAAKLEPMAFADDLKRAVCAVLVSVGQQIPQTPTLKIIEQVTPAIPHLKQGATTLAPWLTDAQLIEPATRLGRFYAGQSAFAAAETWYQQCRQLAETRLGPDHPDVACSLNNLAALYKAQGRYGEAEPLYRQALTIRQQQLGPDHPDVASSLNNLAGLYQAQGRYGEAEPLYRQALTIRQQQLGPDHPDVASSLNNLAGLYQAQGRYGEAEPLYRQALTIRQQQLGPDHPHVASSLNNLAGLYQAQGRYGEAEPLYRQALTIRQQQLGPDHPDVASSLNNLAALYKAQGRYGEAEPLYLQALAILFEKLGADHPNTQGGWQNFLYLLQQAIQAGRTAELSDHPTTQYLLQQLQADP